ncbi:unnamed protein product, partial [Brenthis ino]
MNFPIIIDADNMIESNKQKCMEWGKIFTKPANPARFAGPENISCNNITDKASTSVDILRRAKDCDYNALVMTLPIFVDAYNSTQSENQNTFEDGKD